MGGRFIDVIMVLSGDLTGYCHFQCTPDLVDLPRVQLSYDDEIEIFK